MRVLRLPSSYSVNNAEGYYSVMDPLSLLLTGLACLVVLKLLLSWMKKPKYFPGPPRLPFIGNMLQMPESESWVTYKKWGETYGIFFSHPVYMSIQCSHIRFLKIRRRDVPGNSRQSSCRSELLQNCC